jgi:hypothetical protein
LLKLLRRSIKKENKMAAKKAANKAAKANKDNNTILNAGKPKLDNTMDGSKSAPAFKKWKADKSTAKTFSTGSRMKKPTK